MKNLIKWVLEVTQRSKEHADSFDDPVAVIINWIFGGSVTLSALISVTIIMLALMADVGQMSDARVPVILTIVLLAAWYVALRIVEIYLNFVESKEE